VLFSRSLLYLYGGENFFCQKTKSKYGVYHGAGVFYLPNSSRS